MAFSQTTKGKKPVYFVDSGGLSVIDQPTPQEIQADRLRLVVENRRLLERCQQLETRCRICSDALLPESQSGGVSDSIIPVSSNRNLNQPMPLCDIANCADFALRPSMHRNPI